MELNYGAEVVDKNGEILGQVGRLVRNLSTGEIITFMVHRKGPERDLFIHLDDIMEATETRVTLKVSFEELSQR